MKQTTNANYVSQDITSKKIRLIVTINPEMGFISIRLQMFLQNVMNYAKLVMHGGK
jgi:hypothetical protein